MDDLIRLLAPKVELKRRGSNLIGCCPFHQERTGSFTVYPDGHYRCYGCGAHGLVAHLLGRNARGVKFEKPPDKPKWYSPLDWMPFRRAMTRAHCERLSKWRGYSLRFCERLHGRNLIGIFEDQFCFPIMHDGHIRRVHVRMDERRSKRWTYFPVEGCPSSAFIVNEGRHGDTHVFESQWDMFAVMEQIRNGQFVSTRSSANTAKLAGIKPRGRIIAYPQRDESGEQWFAGNGKPGTGIVGLFPSVYLIRSPSKDLNDYTRAGGLVRDLAVVQLS